MSDSIETLTDLLDRASARRFLDLPGLEDFGYADQNNFPFLALVGQHEMKLALLLNLVNPNVGGVLLLGPRGTGKTTAVRSLVDLMPEVPRSRCQYGCMPEDIELGGIDAVCKDCATKYGQDEPLTFMDQVQLIELPLNARLEDVVGGIDERAAVHNRLRLRRGILARADRHLLYIDEVNLLADDVVDVILDAAAQGTYTVHRGSMAGTYRSRFVLIGSMNPEEGQLRPQILDRFGLRVIVRGLDDSEERLEAYRRSVNFLNQPQDLVRAYAGGTNQVRNEIIEARNQLAKVKITEKALSFGLALIKGLGVESLRAEITLFEAARAHAVADGRKTAGIKDIRVTAPLALRSRRSAFIEDYLANQTEEETQLSDLIRSFSKKKKPSNKPASKKGKKKPNKP